MNKNFKILSSLAAAGIITVTGLTSTVSAATPNSLGVYRKVISGETIAPYVVATANDKVTVQDLKNDHGNITISLSNNEKVATGTTFRKNGESHTVIIYGDVDGNGDINVNDVTTLAQGVVKGNLTAVKKEAGNVEHNNSTDVNDVTKLARFIVKGEKITVSLPSEEVEENYDYKLQIVDTTSEHNSMQYLNKESIKAFGVNISLNKTLSEANFKTKLRVLDKDGKKVEDFDAVNAPIPAHQDLYYVAVNGLDAKVTENGNITIQLVEIDGKKETVLGKTVVEVNQDVPVVGKVSVTRNNTRNASISLTNIGGNDLAKMYYIVQEDATAPAALTKTIPLGANGISNVAIANDLVEGKTYNLFYIVEDIYGNKSDVSSAVVVPSDKATQATAVEKDGFTLPDLKGNDEFKWTLKDIASSTDFSVVLYKDGKAVAEAVVQASTVADSVKDFTDKMTEAGKYKIGVTVKGNGTTTSDSVEVQSAEVEVKALNAATDVTFAVKKEGNTSKKVLSWKNSNKAENFKDYTLKLYQLDETKGEYGVPTTTILAKADVTEKDGVVEYNITIDDNKVYKAEVIVNKLENQKAVVSSQPAASEGFFVIGNLSASSVTPNSDKSMTITLANEVKVNNKAATYKVEIHKYVKGTDSMGNPTRRPELVRTDDVTLTDKKLVVNNLEADTEYSFKIIATVDGIQGESDYTTAVSTLKRTPKISGLTVVKKAEDAKANTIYVNGDKVTINGEEPITVDAASNYATEFKNTIAMVKVLLEGDAITVDGTTVTLKLARINNGTLALGTTAKDLTVVIEGNDYERIITTTKGSEPAEVVLAKEGSLFNVGNDITGLFSKKITLNPGVEVLGTKKVYNVAANTEATAVVINGIKVTAAKNAVMETTTNTEAGKDLIVTAGSNDLIFENTAGGNLVTRTATIKFKGEENLSASQSGSIVIKTAGGKVTVEQDNANVNSSIKVEVNEGEVDIKDVALTGTQNVTVTNGKDATTTVSIKAETKAPVAMTTVEIADYSEKTVEELNAITGLSGVTTENREAVVNFINSFKIEEGKATITAEADSNVVKLVFNKEVENAVVGGLQK